MGGTLTLHELAFKEIGGLALVVLHAEVAWVLKVPYDKLHRSAVLLKLLRGLLLGRTTSRRRRSLALLEIAERSR